MKKWQRCEAEPFSERKAQQHCAVAAAFWKSLSQAPKSELATEAEEGIRRPTPASAGRCGCSEPWDALRPLHPSTGLGQNSRSVTELRSSPSTWAVHLSVAPSGQDLATMPTQVSRGSTPSAQTPRKAPGFCWPLWKSPEMDFRGCSLRQVHR